MLKVRAFEEALKKSDKIVSFSNKFEALKDKIYDQNRLSKNNLTDYCSNK